MTKKLELLKKYIELQAEDDGLWFRSEKITENYLQQELRKIAWMIEEASIEQIENEISFYKDKLED